MSLSKSRCETPSNTPNDVGPTISVGSCEQRLACGNKNLVLSTEFDENRPP